DLFIGNYLGFITYYENIGDSASPSLNLVTRAFEGIDISAILYAGKTAPRLFDLDGDQDKDLLFGDGRGLIHFWENIGTPEASDFEFITDSLEYIDISGYTRFDLTDIDSDGDFDLFIGNYYGYILFYQNIGSANELDFMLFNDQFANIDVGNSATPSFVDIDADNDMDLFVGNRAGHIWYYRNDGDSANYNYTYVTDNYNDIWVDSYAAPEFADIDGDGDYDLFVGRENQSAVGGPGDLFFYQNIGTPEVAEWQLITRNYLSIDQGEDSQNHHADIDADFDIDLFSSNRSDKISFYQNIGNQTDAQFRWITDAYQQIEVNDAYIFFSDIDTDLDSDLFIGEFTIPNPPYPGLHLFQNIGTPQNAQFTLYSNNFIPGNYAVGIRIALVDIDGDDDEDLFLTNGDNSNLRYYFENVGSSTSPIFASPVMNWFGAFPPIPYGYLASFCFYDIDNDSDFDLFGVPHSLDDEKWVWFYRNTGSSQIPSFTLETEYFLPLERGDNFVGTDIFDLDSDGDGDFLLSLTYDGGMYFFRNTTGDTSAVEPRLRLDPLHGIQFSIGPNPANPITWISYNLPYQQRAEIAVYNLLGQKVATLASGLQMPGQKTLIWDAANYSSGQYFVRMETEVPDAGLGTIRLQSIVERVVVVK
ncbi:MAG: FG-GAP-like repeat-containing protein, partial [bacterium]